MPEIFALTMVAGGNPQRRIGLLGEAHRFFRFPHGGDPVADFHFGPGLGEENPREVAEPSLVAQRHAGCSQKSNAEVERPDDIGGTAEGSGGGGIVVSAFGELLEPRVDRCGRCRAARHRPIPR